MMTMMWLLLLVLISSHSFLAYHWHLLVQKLLLVALRGYDSRLIQILDVLIYVEIGDDCGNSCRFGHILLVVSAHRATC